jgi:hypothetical protein
MPHLSEDKQPQHPRIVVVVAERDTLRPRSSPVSKPRYRGTDCHVMKALSDVTVYSFSKTGWCIPIVTMDEKMAR